MASPSYRMLPNDLGASVTFRAGNPTLVARLSRAGAALAGVTSLLVIIGWYAGNSGLKQLLPGDAVMRPNSALALTAIAIAVALPRGRRLTAALGAATTALGLATLAEYLFAIKLGIDQLLPGVDLGRSHPRMAPATAIALCLLGAATTAAGLGRGRLLRALALGALAVGQVAILGYAYQVPVLYTAGGATLVSLPTAFCVVLLSLSLLLREPLSGLVGLLGDRGSAGRLLRLLVPSLLLGPALLGWLALMAEDHGWFDTRFGVALLILCMTGLTCTLSWRVGVQLRELDHAREDIAHAQAEANRTLEATVSERTRELAAERRALTEAQRLANLGSFTYDIADQHFIYSEQLLRIWGLPPDGDVAAASRQMIHDEDRPAVDEHWRCVLTEGGHAEFDYRLVRADGEVRHMHGTFARGEDFDGRAVLSGTHLDITELALAQASALRANTFFEAVLTATPDYTFVTELATDAIIYGSSGKDILGLTSEQFQAVGPDLLDVLVHPEDHQRLEAAKQDSAHLGDGQVLQTRYRGRHLDGGWRWLSSRVTPFRRDDEGQVIQVLGVARDITDVVEAEDQLAHGALHDSLTGLPNRALLIDRLDTAMARLGRDGREVAVLYCDLDGFKRVNDTGGHAAGDAVLIEVARRLSGALRDGDTVARVGGDEFVIIVEPWRRQPQSDEPSAAEATAPPHRLVAVQVAQRIGETLRQPILVNGLEHVVTASIGVTYANLEDTQPRGTSAADAVLQDADAAMYRAKRLGKDRFELFEHDLRTDRVERGRVEHVLRQALHAAGAATAGSLRAGQGTPWLTASYQPIFSSDTGALVSFEALARLTDAEGRTITPDVFIGVAEETGLIHPLGSRMLELASAQLHAWRRETPGLEHVTMAVNISALQAQHGQLGEEVRDTVLANALVPADLVLELTETALLQAAQTTITTLRALRAEGVGIAIDDFGIGYSSLRYLATLPVSAIKIDRSFTAGLPHDETSCKIVKAVAGLAAELDLGCIVEGVETTEQRHALPGGVHLQGWLTGRAEPPDDLDVDQLARHGVPPQTLWRARASV